MIRKLIEQFNLRLGACAGAATVILMFSVVPDLVSRSFFGFAIYGMSEASIMLLVFIVFLALPAAQVRKEHFQVSVLDAVLSAVNTRRLWIFRHFVSFLITSIFAWYSFIGASESVARLEQSYAVIEFPVWPAKIAVACGFFLLAVQFLLDMIAVVRQPADVSVDKVDVQIGSH